MGDKTHRISITDTLDNFPLLVEEVYTERLRQRTKWGTQKHSPFFWLGILVEEIGEFSKALLECDVGGMRRELIHTAAVALAIASGINDLAALDAVAEQQGDKMKDLNVKSLKPITASVWQFQGWFLIEISIETGLPGTPEYLVFYKTRKEAQKAAIRRRKRYQIHNLKTRVVDAVLTVANELTRKELEQAVKIIEDRKKQTAKRK